MKVFYSYSHRDESFRAELEKHLTLLKQQNLIDEWHDRRIAAGADIREDIDSHFEQSEIIILLLSPDFLLSPECNKEMDRAITRQQQDDAIVIPVILRPCAWMHSGISHLKALPTDGKPITTWQDRDDAFVDIYRAIKGENTTPAYSTTDYNRIGLPAQRTVNTTLPMFW